LPNLPTPGGRQKQSFDDRRPTAGPAEAGRSNARPEPDRRSIRRSNHAVKKRHNPLRFFPDTCRHETRNSTGNPKLETTFRELQASLPSRGRCARTFRGAGATRYVSVMAVTIQFFTARETHPSLDVPLTFEPPPHARRPGFAAPDFPRDVGRSRTLPGLFSPKGDLRTAGEQSFPTRFPFVAIPQFQMISNTDQRHIFS
jgi:hypothetical protein